MDVKALCEPKEPVSPAMASLRGDKCVEQIAKISLGGYLYPRLRRRLAEASCKLERCQLLPHIGHAAWIRRLQVRERPVLNSNGEENSPRARQWLKATAANFGALM